MTVRTLSGAFCMYGPDCSFMYFCSVVYLLIGMQLKLKQSIIKILFWYLYVVGVKSHQKVLFVSVCAFCVWTKLQCSFGLYMWALLIVLTTMEGFFMKSHSKEFTWVVHLASHQISLQKMRILHTTTRLLSNYLMSVWINLSTLPSHIYIYI